MTHEFDSEKILQLTKPLLGNINDYGININVEELMFKYNNIFWNSIWYFKLYNLDCDFMLPYYDNNEREEFDTNIRVITNKIF